MTMKESRACGFLIVRQTNGGCEFLLMQHKDRWDLPKGHVEPGETDMQCALRELQEETGICADDIRVHDEFRFTTNYLVRKKRFGKVPANKTVIIYLATLVRERPIVATEHIDFRWFAWNPPHAIQTKTIDPLLAYAEHYLGNETGDATSHAS